MPVDTKRPVRPKGERSGEGGGFLSFWWGRKRSTVKRLALAYRPAGWNLLLLILLVTVAAVELAVGVAVEVAALLGMEAAALSSGGGGRSKCSGVGRHCGLPDEGASSRALG
ncbi:hypothetical protein ACHAW5_009482 [Stephanodiscus triporus]|uniref:Uncharacterized protein n=1 Tax=Stephanodiscus triporus TaxID=2934178 RepID=A0ABD3QS60_9STRA